MKQFYLLLIFVLFIPRVGFSQIVCETYFDSMFTVNECFPVIDTFTNSSNQWEIGAPLKTVFNSSSCPTNGIVTNLTNPYPINNKSSFVIACNYLWCNEFRLGFSYFVDSDSLNDYGMIEFSPDNGNTWNNMLDGSFCFTWANGSNLNSPVLTGTSSGWKHSVGSFDFCIDPIIYDTVLFKFSFVSDSTFDNRDGLIFDNIYIWSWVNSVEENNFLPSKVYPNPANKSITIESEVTSPYGIVIYDVLGKFVMKKEQQFDKIIELDVSCFDKGIYTYNLIGEKGEVISLGKFLKH